ncbi:hypothetical protein pEaSNUABM29_00116 [Erwinia phage pEa_SNUABM_29]|nr:hypothetical protein pEaSNUABM29_00116 [Erwinia phage pEa_SNUABM_29]
MMLPYHWKVLSAEQIDRDLYGTRIGTDSPTLIAFPSRGEAIKAGIEYAASKNRGSDGGQNIAATVKVQQIGNTLKLCSTGGWANQMTTGDSLHLYRIDSTHCSEPWLQAYEGSHEYYTRGVTDYEEVIYDTLLNHIKEAGLTVS